MRHKAKLTWWIGAVVFLAPLVPMASFPKPPVTVGFLFSQSSETAETELMIRAGLRTIRIPYAAITAVRPSTDSRSALAMSLDRVLVEYQSGEQLIAPQNQTDFFDDLQCRAPHLSRRGMEPTIALNA